MARHKKQVGGRKEISLAVSNSGLPGNFQYEQSYTHEDEEYQRYSELLRGFFEKISRWQDILIAEGKHEGEWSDISIFHSGKGELSIKTVTASERAEPPDKVIGIRNSRRNSEGMRFAADFFIRPGAAGKQFFVDPEGNLLQDVEIRVSNDRSIASKRLIIDAEYPFPQEKPAPHIAVEYWLRGNTLTIERYLFHEIMPETYQIHLFSTIDSLIPGNTPPTPQKSRRESGEPQTPKALPPARRRRPGGRT